MTTPSGQDPFPSSGWPQQPAPAQPQQPWSPPPTWAQAAPAPWPQTPPAQPSWAQAPDPGTGANPPAPAAWGESAPTAASAPAGASSPAPDPWAAHAQQVWGQQPAAPVPQQVWADPAAAQTQQWGTGPQQAAGPAPAQVPTGWDQPQQVWGTPPPPAQAGTGWGTAPQSQHGGQPLGSLPGWDAAAAGPAATWDPTFPPPASLTPAVDVPLWRRVPRKVAITAVAAAVGAGALFVGVTTLAGHGDTPSGGAGVSGSAEAGARGQAPAPQPAPQGATQFGPVAFTLPGTWTAQGDQSVFDAAKKAAADQGKQVTDMWVLSSDQGNVMAVQVAAGSHPGRDQTLADAMTQLRETMPTAGEATTLPYAGALPGTAAQVDLGPAQLDVVYLDLPDGSLLMVTVSGQKALFADGAVAQALTNPVYTG